MRRGTTLLAALLSGAMMMGIAAGCGGNTQTTTTGASGTAAPTTAAPAAEKKIRVAWWGNQVRNDGTVAVLNLYSEKIRGLRSKQNLRTGPDTGIRWLLRLLPDRCRILFNKTISIMYSINLRTNWRV